MFLFLLSLVAVLFISDLFFSVWQHLEQQAIWLQRLYIVLLFMFATGFSWLIWRVLRPKKSLADKQRQKQQNITSISATEQRLGQINEVLVQQVTKHPDVDVCAIEEPKPIDEIDQQSKKVQQWSEDFTHSNELLSVKKELLDYSKRKAQEIIYIAFFGNISSGKSSVIKALQEKDQNNKKKSPENSIETHVLGGTTREIKHFYWYPKINDNIQKTLLTDMPGVNEQFAQLDTMASDEVQRTHIVVYLCDGDLSASQFDELRTILSLSKPCIVAINKSDQYTQIELQLIVDKLTLSINGLRQQLSKDKSKFVPMQANIPLVMISAGGMRDFIRLTPDGHEERVQRSIPIDIESLDKELLTLMQCYTLDQLEQLREKSVAQMLNTQLDNVEQKFKRSHSQRLIKTYTQKAVVASMATISPGTDILIQGYLGIQMIKDLCKLYDVNATDIDANKLIELIQLRMDKTLPLLLAIAGNGLKAFPGIGTVTGGLVHAVAYGMIFDTLGRSVARTLEVTGKLSPTLVSDLYKEQLSENIESRATDFIKLVLKLRKKDG